MPTLTQFTVVSTNTYFVRRMCMYKVSRFTLQFKILEGGNFNVCCHVGQKFFPPNFAV